MFLLLWGLHFKFKGNAFAGVTAGAVDEVKTWTDVEIEKADLDREMLVTCYPPSDHFDEDGYNNMVAFVRKGDYRKAVDSLSTSVLEKATPFCVSLFKKVALEAATQCPKLLSDALPMSYF